MVEKVAENAVKPQPILWPKHSQECSRGVVLNAVGNAIGNCQEPRMQMKACMELQSKMCTSVHKKHIQEGGCTEVGPVVVEGKIWWQPLG